MIVTCVSLLVALSLASWQSGELELPRDVSFASKVDGTEQRYVLMLPKMLPETEPVDLMIALHGHGSDRWQFVRDARDECRAARDAAARQHMLYVCPDYRAKTSWMSPAATADVLQILEDLKQQYRIRRVLVCGGSMGGSSALAFAAMHPDRVQGVVSMNGTANMLEYAGFTEAIEQAYGASKRDKPEVYRERSAELHAQQFKFPVATTTGGHDELVPPDSTLRFMEKLKQQNTPGLSIHRPTGGHSTTYEDATKALQFVLDNW